MSSTLCQIKIMEFKTSHGRIKYKIDLPIDEANLSGIDLKGIDCSEQLLLNANFSGAVLTLSVFDDANLTSARFYDAILSGASFMYSILHNADFSRADISETSFHDSDITGANFSDCIFQNADFTNAKADKTTIFPKGFDLLKNKIIFLV